MKIRHSGISLRSVAIVVAAILLMTAGFWMLSQSSPAVVKAQTGLGGPLPNLTSLETTMFNSGKTIFERRWDSVHGLGPVFTQVSCSLCHLLPVVGGASTTKNTFFGKINQDGSFNPLTEEGGMFLQPFSIQRFTPGCILRGEVVPADATVHAKHLTPEVFGMGLIDSIPDQDIRAQAIDKGLGIHGIVDEVTDEKGNARVGKYGYKAQFATVMQITASAMVHDIGITSPLEPIEDKPQGVDPMPQCLVSSEPNDPDGANLLATFHFVMYLAPKIFGIADALLRAPRRYGGVGRILAGGLVETIFTFLLLPVSMFNQTLFMAGLLFGRNAGWDAQQRDGYRVPWTAAARGLWPATSFGLLVLGFLAFTAPAVIPWFLPFLGGLVLAIPFAVLTSLPEVGAAAVHWRLCAIPEEFETPAEISALLAPDAAR